MVVSPVITVQLPFGSHVVSNPRQHLTHSYMKPRVLVSNLVHTHWYIYIKCNTMRAPNVRAIIYMLWSYVLKRPRAGAKPRPDPRQSFTYFKFKYIQMDICNKNQSWPNGRGSRAKSLGVGRGPGVEPRGLHHSFYTSIINQPTRDTWCPWIGPRALIPFAVNQTRVSMISINQSINLPHHHRMTCTVLPRQTVQIVRTGTVNIKIFACLAW
jgi:hypothetical protein